MVKEQLKRFADSVPGLVLDYVMKLVIIIGLPVGAWFAQSHIAHSEQIIRLQESIIEPSRVRKIETTLAGIEAKMDILLHRQKGGQ